jgi:hypothetical protein
MKKKLIITLFVVAILAMVWGVFGQCASFQFLRFDDHDYTFFCPFVRTGLTVENIIASFTNFTHAAIWMPITYISYMFDVALWRGTAGAFHVTNVIIHSLNALLVFIFLRSLVKLFSSSEEKEKSSFELMSMIGCSIIAICWAIHPQRVESVAWIAGRKDLLCTFFVLLGAIACGKWSKGKYIEETSSLFSQGLLWSGVIVCSLLASMCKPAAMCFPFLMLSIEGIYFSKRVTYSYLNVKKISLILFRYLPMLIIAVATGALAVYSQTHADGYGVRELFSASLPWRILNAMVATGRYLFMSVIPVGIHLDYRAIPEALPLNSFTGLTTLLVVSGLFVLSFIKFPRSRFVLFMVAIWFFAALVPTLGIFGSFGEHAMADRFYYLPSLAFVIIGAILFSKLRDILYALHKGSLKYFILYVVGAIIVCLAGMSFVVTRSYRNDLAVFTRTLECDANHGRALAHVGEGECAEGKLDEGIDKLRRSMKLRPRFDTSAKLSYALMRRGKSADFKEIKVLCSDIAKNRKSDQKGQALEALGTALLVERNWQGALECLYDSICAPRRFYSPEDAKLKLAFAFYNVGRKKDAMKLFSALEHSTRSDISSRATQAMETIHSVGKGHVVLFW